MICSLKWSLRFPPPWKPSTNSSGAVLFAAWPLTFLNIETCVIDVFFKRNLILNRSYEHFFIISLPFAVFATYLKCLHVDLHKITKVHCTAIYSHKFTPKRVSPPKASKPKPFVAKSELQIAPDMPDYASAPEMPSKSEKKFQLRVPPSMVRPKPKRDSPERWKWFLRKCCFLEVIDSPCDCKSFGWHGVLHSKSSVV